MHRSIKSRRGITAVLAMMYLGLFSVLALGFFASVSTSGQIAENDMNSVAARHAAESGMQFIKHHLNTIQIPKDTKRAQILAATYTALSARLDGQPCMKGATVGVSGDGTKVYVPGPGDAYITSDANGAEFRLEISRYGDWGLRVRSVGRANPKAIASTDVRGGRGVQLDYDNVPKETEIFGYGVASRGPVTMDSNATITGVGVGNESLGSLLITATTLPALTMKSNTRISGDVGFPNPTGAVLPQPNTRIGGELPSSLNYSSHIDTVASPPEFPAVDTEDYLKFVGSGAGYGGITVTPPNSSGETKLTTAARNILIKPSPHVDHWVVIEGSQTIDGIIYIQTPNKVRIDSNVVIRGAIVVENNPVGDSTRNMLTINSNVTLKKIQSLEALNSPYFPPAMTSLTGGSILAPNFSVTLNSNFGVEGGSIIADRITFDSNANGTIDGSVIALGTQPLLLNGNANVGIKSLTNGLPPGLRFTSSYKPLPTTYREFRPD